MRAAIIALGAIFLLLSLSHSAAAHGDVLRAKVIFLGLGSGVISPDGSSVEMKASRSPDGDQRGEWADALPVVSGRCRPASKSVIQRFE